MEMKIKFSESFKDAVRKCAASFSETTTEATLAEPFNGFILSTTELNGLSAMAVFNGEELGVTGTFYLYK